VPAGVAAVAIDPAAIGDIAVFAAGLAVVLVLLAAVEISGGGRRDLLRLRIARAC
jgi:hypothetical protein